LVELVVTLAIVGLLASAAFPLASVSVQRTKEQDLRRALIDIRSALDRYKRLADLGHIEKQPGASGYPPALNVLVDGVKDTKDPDARLIYFLRKLPADPFNNSESPSWGLRSYESSSLDPQEGDDVFDVYSLSSSSGLNGVAYATW